MATGVVLGAGVACGVAAGVASGGTTATWGAGVGEYRSCTVMGVVVASGVKRWSFSGDQNKGKIRMATLTMAKVMACLGLGGGA